MKKIVLLVFIISLSPLCHANDFDNLPEVQAIQNGMPEDVAKYLPRLVECNHSPGEVAYDPDTAKFIKVTTDEAGCVFIKKNEVSLRQKYKKNPQVLNAIQKAKDQRMGGKCNPG